MFQSFRGTLIPWQITHWDCCWWQKKQRKLTQNKTENKLISTAPWLFPHLACWHSHWARPILRYHGSCALLWPGAGSELNCDSGSGESVEHRRAAINLRPSSGILVSVILSHPRTRSRVRSSILIDLINKCILNNSLIIVLMWGLICVLRWLVNFKYISSPSHSVWLVSEIEIQVELSLSVVGPESSKPLYI